MEAIIIIVGLALGLAYLQRFVDRLVPGRPPALLTGIIAVAVGAGLAWAIDYSVFAAVGQDLRAEWMHPVMTGLVLVAGGEFLRRTVDAVAHREGSTTSPVKRSA